MYMKVLSSSDAANLSNLIKDGDWMVLYYAEWCGHCNAMKPEWEKFINKMKDPNINSTNIKIADVKSDFIGDLKENPNVPGFPTIKMYSKGKEVADFQDERVADKMMEFAKSNSKPSRITVKSNANEINSITSQISNKETMKPIAEPIVEPLTTKELPMVPVPIEQPIIRKSTRKSRVSSMRHSVKPIQMNNLIKRHSVKSRSKSRKSVARKASVKLPMQPQQHQQIPDPNMPCNQIRKAKFCKANPKCMFDYPGNKCVDKPTQHISRKKTSKKQNNAAKSTKEVFGELIKSFGRISNEANKDAKLLKQASNKL